MSQAPLAVAGLGDDRGHKPTSAALPASWFQPSETHLGLLTCRALR